MIAFYGSQISDHMAKTPEGYLVCYAVPINRIGEQIYTARDLNLDGDPDRLVKVYRLPEDVFSPAALASFEGKDVTQTHPPDNLTPETQAAYSKGHLENVRQSGENTVADLMIKDPGLISDVENGVMREVSCGYTCVYVPYKDGYKQINIVGNHVAVVPKGRAGATVAIKDAAHEAEEKRRNPNMSEFWNTVLTAFGMAAKDASPEELDKMVDATANALEAEPAAKKAAPDAEPAEEKAEDVMVERAPKGDDLGSKLDTVIAMLKELDKKNDREEKKLSSEDDLDDLIKKMAGKKEHYEDPEAAVTIPAELMEDACKPMDSATIELLKRVKPAVASIKDPKEKARVVDALIGTVKGSAVMDGILSATRSSAAKAADATARTNYEKICADSENAYAERNPHKKEAK